MFAWRWNSRDMGEGQRVNALLKSTVGRTLTYKALIDAQKGCMTEQTKPINIGFNEALSIIAKTPKSLLKNELEVNVKKVDKKIQIAEEEKVTQKK